MRTNFEFATPTQKRLNELKAQMIKLSKSRSVDDIKAWWIELSNADKALVLSSLNTILLLPAVWSMGWLWKTLLLGGVAVGTYQASKAYYDVLDEIADEKLSNKLEMAAS